MRPLFDTRHFLIALLLHSSICTSGCFAHALHQRYAEQALGAHSVLQKGTSRSDVTRVLGNPSTTTTDDGKAVDTFSVPNDTWAEGYSGSSSVSGGDFRPGPGDAQFLAALLMIALAVELVVDPVLTCVYLYQARDATRCEYKVTYDEKGCVEKLDVTYPQGFGTNVCASWITTPK